MAVRQRLEMLRRYLGFVARTGSKQPRSLRAVPRWAVYSFLPNRSRPPAGGEVLSSSQVDEAVKAFRRDGYVVLSDALTQEEAAELGRLIRTRGEEVVRLEDAGELPGRNPWRELKRYAFNDYGPSPQWEYLASNEPVLRVLRGIWKGRDFGCWGTGGDFVMPGGTWQVIHSDLEWDSAGDEVPLVLVVNYYVSEVSPTNGAMRLLPGTAHFPPPSHWVKQSEPSWMQQSLVAGLPGFAVIRDPRAWHGGTPNTSSEPRYVPSVEYVLRNVPLGGLTAKMEMEPPHQRDWVAEFSNS